ncbi:MAG TPA: sulfite exporter TauE/SafE family protein [Paenalcaligenes sp.]|nr:sulfite exporter TauE/SafE family protein [Paenalcaligenes sp.]
MSYSLGVILLFTFAIMIAGVVAGVIAGLLGVGGGIVLVPILFYLFIALGVDESVRMHLAVGTSLTTIVATAASSTRAHYARGSIDTTLLRSWGPWLFIGAVLGMIVFSSIKTAALSLIFGGVAALVAIYMLVSKEPETEDPDKFPKGIFRWLLGLIVGGVSSIMGIGGGTLSVPILSIFKYPIRRAVGTAAAIGLLISIPGAVGAFLSGMNHPDLPPFSFGYVNLLAFIILVPITGFMAPYGAKMAHTIKPRHLKLAFVAFLLFNSANMIISAL